MTGRAWGTNYSMRVIKALAVRALLKLPAGWIYRVSGGKPMEIAGRVMDPHTQLISYLAGKGPSFKDVSIEEARAMMSEALSMTPAQAETGVQVEAAEFVHGKSTIQTRIYRPDAQNPKACVLLYYHAGGGVFGDLEMCHAFCSLLASSTRGPVISVDYRLAPENPWPSGLEDCAAAFRWALAQAEHMGAPEGRAAVAGDSIGGNYAAAVSQLMREEGAPQPEYQLLICPSLDFAHETEAMKTYSGIFPMTEDLLGFLLPRFIPSGIERDDPRLSPLCRGDLSDLPTALIYTAGFDFLQDQGRLYHERLLDAGGESKLVCFESLSHGFTSFMGISPAARAACVQIAEAVKRLSE